MMSAVPPRGLRWLDAPLTRQLTTFAALVALLAASYFGVRQQQYGRCVAEHQRADAIRTQAIAGATDSERKAQRRLLTEVTPSNAAALRAAVLQAYDLTDQIRATYPPVPSDGC